MDIFFEIVNSLYFLCFLTTKCCQGQAFLRCIITAEAIVQEQWLSNFRTKRLQKMPKEKKEL